MKKLFYLTFIALLAVNCKSSDDAAILPVENAKPITLKAGLEKRINQDNEFAFDLLRNTIENNTDKNVFVSPLSVSIALGMARNGASGETKTSIETALKMSGLSTDNINEYYRIMQTTLPSIDPTTKLSIANSVWYRSGFPIKQTFLDINTANFNTYIKSLDFAQIWAKDTINNWCSKKTNGLIPSIIDGIPENAMMYLVNAVYFKGIWRSKFDKASTSEMSFIDENNALSEINMMSKEDTFGYYSDDKAQYLDMPYGNNAFSMTVVLPITITATELLSDLSAESWNTALNRMVQCKVKVYLPRFKVQNKFKLNKVLSDMGMSNAFSETAADFSEISVQKLFISEVLHKTYITVDEDGTEAAAVTSIGFANTSMPNYPIFMANKPFLFIIREKSTGIILFIGKMGGVERY